MIQRFFTRLSFVVKVGKNVIGEFDGARPALPKELLDELKELSSD
jgi:hypothetical protein